MEHYRYVEDHYDGEVKLFMQTFFTLRETSKGYWVIPEYLNNQHTSDKTKEDGKRFVLKNATRKHCHETKEAAMRSYYKRKCKQVKILESRLEISKRARDIASMIFVDGKNELEFM